MYFQAISRQFNGQTPIYGNQEGENQESGHVPQIRGHVNVSMTHLSQPQPEGPQEGQGLPVGLAKMETPDHVPGSSVQTGPTTTSTFSPPKSTGEMVDIKRFYENDEDEDVILEDVFTKAFSENKPKCKSY